MWINLFIKISSATLLTMGYCFCISFLVHNDFKLKRPKNALFVVLVTPVVYFTYQGFLMYHILTCFLAIIAIAFLYKKKIFYASYTMAIVYLVAMMSSVITGITAITLFGEVKLTEILYYFSDYRLNILKLVFMMMLAVIYSMFIKMFRERLAEQKSKPSSLHLINVLAILIVMVVSNFFIRYVSVNSVHLNEIKNLMLLLFISYLLYVVSSLYFIYSMNIHIFNNQKIIEIKEYADTDIMTGVLNRQAGLDALTEQIRYTKRTSTELTICFVDINNLKVVNDKYGHNEGDLLIELVSETIKVGLREFDFVCRLGGDEFLIVFNKCSMKLAQVAWIRIYNSICRLNENTDITFPISVSYGFAEYNPIESLSLKEFIDKADAAMYENKKKYKSLKSKSESVKTESTVVKI